MSVTSSTEELQRIIDLAIIKNPFNESNDLPSILQSMKEKGIRPITPTEYRQSLLQSKAIKLWLPIEPMLSAKKDCKQLSVDSTQDSSSYDSNIITGDRAVALSVVATSTSLSQQITEAWNEVTYELITDADNHCGGN